MPTHPRKQSETQLLIYNSGWSSRKLDFAHVCSLRLYCLVLAEAKVALLTAWMGSGPLGCAKTQFCCLGVSQGINMIMDSSINLFPWARFAVFWDIAHHPGNSPHGRRTLEQCLQTTGLCPLCGRGDDPQDRGWGVAAGMTWWHIGWWSFGEVEHGEMDKYLVLTF